MKTGSLRGKVQDRLWWKLAEHIPGGTYNHPWLSRFLFCWPCEPTEDMCRIPEHDYCVRCGRPMPNQAPRGNPSG